MWPSNDVNPTNNNLVEDYSKARREKGRRRSV
jgi:hypothetical protein